MPIKNNNFQLPGSIASQPLNCAYQRQQCGATSIEYALLSSLIAMVILVSVGSTGSSVLALWTNIAAQITAAIG